MFKWHRYRRRLLARMLKLPEQVFVLDPYEVREALEGNVR